MKFEKTISEFVEYVINESKTNDENVVRIDRDELIELYKTAKLSNLKYETDVIESDVIDDSPFVQVVESFKIDENTTFNFYVVYSFNGIGGIYATIKHNNLLLFVECS